MTSQISEDRAHAELMEAAQRGDTRAYAQLLRDITPRLRRIIRNQRRFLGPDDIEDIVQDVLLSLHSVRATYDPERPFMPWLFAIARNRLADAARRHARRGVHEIAAEAVPVTFFEEAANIEDEEYRDPEELRRAIQALPAGQREAIEMLKIRGMSLKEASAAKGISISALKVSVHRATIALRKTLMKK